MSRNRGVSAGTTELMLEALVARVASTLELLFPGSEVNLEGGRQGYWYQDIRITLTTNHPRMPGGRYCTMHSIPEELFRMEGERFVQHLIRTLPVDHIRQMADLACDEARASRFKRAGYIS